ncbi:MAG TPA: ATP-binding protein, partial [Ottowia sp.]|uniref:sensor histidine kinase n=1 Tax=Ottowia sp. TaxID=1898956 RepID=UPI002BEEEFD0
NMTVPEELMASADEIELSRVLSNVLENARRYGKSPGTNYTRVDITVKFSDTTVTIRMRDHGPGVSPDLLPNLTRPFFRGDTARTSATGAGLGLAIVAKMVHNMGGALELANSPSGGLMAVIRLQQATESRQGSLLKKRR